ncbi:assimilatory nitrate reductase (NADH) alpha subunit apoprotein [Rhizobiales bacterium GAS191]|nr:assimilatory nitrate reductase (NADH) alpha subunit apoprotein [Rhizobiales bacterium GAS191]
MFVAPEPPPVRSTCPYCGVGCGIVARADGTIAGDPDHPANAGRLCSKGSALAETLGDTSRLLYPSWRGQRIGWSEALDLIAGTFTDTIAQHGPDAVALYGSGQFLTEDYYVANKLMKGFIGTANIDTNSRLCMASSVAGHVRAFGEDVVPGCYDDIEAADLMVLVGSNAAWCHPVLFQRMMAAKAERGTRIIVIDPRRTASCDGADLHLALRPGSDVALFAGLLAHLAETEALASRFIEAHSSGFAATLAEAHQTAPSLDKIAALTDLPPEAILAFYAEFAATERVVTFYSQGVNQSSAGTDKVNAILNCHLATGRIGRSGMGPFSLTGQPNAMGGREVGGLANQLAAHMSFAEPADVDRVRRFWQAPRMAQRPGLKAVELFDAVLDGKVKALWILATNPAVSLPRSDRVRAALDACPFVVVSDCWPTDTTAHADLVLPAAGFAEKDGTVTNSERYISRQRAFKPPPGEARPDWWALCEVGRRMGFGEGFAYAHPAEIFREHAALSAFENDGARAFDLGGLTGLSLAEYERLEPTQWPVPKGAGRGGRLFGDGRFMHKDGKARFVPTPWRAPADAVDAVRQLSLNTGRQRDQWHTMTRTGLVARLAQHTSEPFLDIHPQDAAAARLADGGLAQIGSRHGAAVMRVRLSEDQRRGEVFASMHWNDRFASTGPIDRLVGAQVDPVSGQPEFKATPVALQPRPILWQGLLLRRAETAFAPDDTYWSRTAIDGGFAYALAGCAPLAASGEGPSQDWVASMLGTPARRDLVVYADPARGVFRYASFVEGVLDEGVLDEGLLDSCLFVARESASLPAPDLLARIFATPLAPAARTRLLSGRAGAGRSAGRTICACFGVGRDTLVETIAEEGLDSVAAIGRALRAGTNCGSCIPELKALLTALA